MTGASRGLGHALTAELVRRRWQVVIDARDGRRLAEAVRQLTNIGAGSVTAVPGDVSDAAHRRALADAVTAAGGLDLLVKTPVRSVQAPNRPSPTIRPERLSASTP